MKSVFDFSERFGARQGGYRDLMGRQVRHVMLVSSLYESFILAEDGHLHDKVLGTFMEASPREPPALTRVSSGRAALKLLSMDHRPVDLVVTSPHVGDMDAVQLANAFQEAGHDVPVAVLAYDREELQPHDDVVDAPNIIGRFVYQGDAGILLAIVQLVEDRQNAKQDTRVGVPIFLVVEDNVRFYSAFMPLVYRELQNLSDAVQLEAGNRVQRIMRARARPKVLLATTYEHAFSVFEQYRSSIMGVFSDMRFPRDGASSATAGEELVAAIRALEPEVPIALQSSHEGNRAVAAALGVGFMLKGSPDFLGQVRAYLSSHLFFGDFIFREAAGFEITRAKDLKSLVGLLVVAPADSVAFHARRHDFSRWLRARGEFGLASKLRARVVADYESVEDLRQSLVHDIDRYRRERNRGSVVPFRVGLFDGEEGLVQIGGGSLGGKGRGLAFASRLIDEVRITDRFPGIRVTVPAAIVLGTEVFNRFLDDNELRPFALQNDDDEETLARFLAADLPPDVVQQLRSVLEVVTAPIAVRSSSLLEDSPQQPLAGVYGTWLLPNDADSIDTRLEQLLDAVKRVYATTYASSARAFIRATQYRLEEEAMAVIIQRVVGAPHGDRFYPHFSGVARSHNYYPTPPGRPEDGIAAVALGLGKTVAEGEACLRFAPPHPGHILEHSSVEDMLDHSQRVFYGLQLGEPPPPGGWRHDGAVVRLTLRDAAADGTLAPVGSTYSAENNVIYDGLGRPGVPVVSFAPVLKHGIFPLAEILQELLILGMAGTRLPVEIEFAVTLSSDPDSHSEFAFLQLRPLAVAREEGDVRLDNIGDRRVICESPSVLGHGRIEGLHDIVVVDRNNFDRARSAECAEGVARMNARLKAEGRHYALIGVGRWGSTHPWLGIPVRWEDISEARLMVEAGFRDFRVTPSQGTHFYQNLVSLGIGFLTVNESAGEGVVDWDLLGEISEVSSDGVVRLLRFDEPILAVLNGRKRKGVLAIPRQPAATV